ncbi:helix-turn-helix transcriptional regulator [Flavobacterium sp.]|uniref:helix-turn-helix transcriptional regulator n=1 Tax=Flavobacterium sp. TaxID=239 RepID=UPI003753A787
MIKQRLKDFREKKFTQEEFAYKLGMETSNYNRRENGVTKISKQEWDKMAKILETTLDEIYEPEDGVYVINGDYAHGNFGNNHIFNTQSEFVFETMKKYILKLEEENQQLKEQLRK